MSDNVLVDGEDSCITSIEVDPDNVNASEYGTGLKNEVGEYNCFLNVIIQVNLLRFKFYQSFLIVSNLIFF